MLEVLAAVTALVFQIVVDIAVFLFWELPCLVLSLIAWDAPYSLSQDGEYGPRDGLEADRVYAAQAIAAMTAAGLDAELATHAVVETMKRRQAIDDLTALGISKADASAMVRGATPKRIKSGRV